jgi:hypothetical protein
MHITTHLALDEPKCQSRQVCVSILCRLHYGHFRFRGGKLFLGNGLCLARRAALRTIPAMQILRHVQLVRPGFTNVAATFYALRDMASWPHTWRVCRLVAKSYSSTNRCGDCFCAEPLCAPRAGVCPGKSPASRNATGEAGCGGGGGGRLPFPA